MFAKRHTYRKGRFIVEHGYSKGIDAPPGLGISVYQRTIYFDPGRDTHRLSNQRLSHNQ